MARITAARALTVRLARRFIRLATFVAVGVLLAFTVGVWLLAQYVSSWWWLLLLPLVIIAILLVLLRLLLSFIIRRIHHQPLTTEQAELMDRFIDKVQSILEARATPFPLIVLICLKDILIHRDIITVKSVINDSSTLMTDYKQIERLFN